MTDERDPRSDIPPRAVRHPDGTIVPGTQPAHEPQVVRGSAFAAMPETPFSPDPAIAGGQMPLQPGDGPKQAVDPNQPVYANPQASAAWAARRPPGEKERIERALNEGVEEDPRVAAADNADPRVVAPDQNAPEGEHAQETEEARRLHEENERAEAARREEEQRNQQNQG
jgi:hypothetical protein